MALMTKRGYGCGEEMTCDLILTLNLTTSYESSVPGIIEEEGRHGVYISVGDTNNKQVIT